MVHSLYPNASIPTGISHLSTMSLNNSLIARLCLRHTIGSGRLHGSFKPLAHGDSDCSGDCHCRVREYRTGGHRAQAWEQRNATYRYEHGGDIGHRLGMLGNEVPQGTARPERRIHHCVIALILISLVSNWTGMAKVDAPLSHVASRVDGTVFVATTMVVLLTAAADKARCSLRKFSELASSAVQLVPSSSPLSGDVTDGDVPLGTITIITCFAVGTWHWPASSISRSRDLPVSCEPGILKRRSSTNTNLISISL